jgi:hypothetical protein
MQVTDKTPKEIAKMLTQKYFDEVTNHMSWDESLYCTKIALELAISVCFKSYEFQGDETPNEDYTKLVQALKIVETELKK